MTELTKAEEQIMQILWDLESGFVNDIVARISDPKPAYNTVSTIVRILEKKEFIGHKAYGKTHEYYPLVSRNDYSKRYFANFLGGYFNGSFANLVSFFAKEEKMDLNTLNELMDNVKRDIESENSKTKTDKNEHTSKLSD